MRKIIMASILIYTITTPAIGAEGVDWENKQKATQARLVKIANENLKLKKEIKNLRKLLAETQNDSSDKKSSSNPKKEKNLSLIEAINIELEYQKKYQKLINDKSLTSIQSRKKLNQLRSNRSKKLTEKFIVIKKAEVTDVKKIGERFVIIATKTIIKKGYDKKVTISMETKEKKAEELSKKNTITLKGKVIFMQVRKIWKNKPGKISLSLLKPYFELSK